VRLGVRPENIELAESGPDVITFDLDFMEELGSQRLLHGRVAGSRVVVSTGLPADAMSPTTSKIAIRPRGLQVFENGQAHGGA
jgi:sn-glycerol 3-phosphate transport system ATP-binding protein